MMIEDVINCKVYSFSENGCENSILVQKSKGELVISVNCTWDDDWFFEFYEEDENVLVDICREVEEFIRVCHTRDEVIEALTEVFSDNYGDILICDGDCDCCCCCDC